ncbi:hypothetical protein BOX15_Mlig026967g1 [Macrostomum lignano]|uniref:Uncharacterized protein n=2 Tax=Macrostomum lignano TaxID=282301 RepID=A0A267GUT1_9PLAT|nr:hypothetical protein BOX15_Mlig026967g1 [Macrostomum lignano]
MIQFLSSPCPVFGCETGCDARSHAATHHTYNCFLTGAWNADRIKQERREFAEWMMTDGMRKTLIFTAVRVVANQRGRNVTVSGRQPDAWTGLLEDCA